ncbi:MAG: hypothetical protein JF607_22115, partial [Burkholderiales bacterium]|nr:hypothetical protein [Burkholderiales bacterium]
MNPTTELQRPPRVRVQRRAVHGVLLLDKPLGLSSNDALQKAKWLLRAEKAGHTGTLDPLATGLLPLCFGAATKFSQLSLDADKRYLATLALGIRTTTGDAEGEVLERHDAEHITPGGASLAALRRTGSGNLTLDGSITLSGLEALPEEQRATLLTSPDRLLADAPELRLPASEAARFLSGLRRRVDAPDAERVRVYGP